MGSDSDGDDYNTRPLLVYLQSRLQHSPNAKHTLLVVVEDEDNRRLRHVDARDRRKRGGRQPSSREVHTACFPLPHLQSFICVR